MNFIPSFFCILSIELFLRLAYEYTVEMVVAVVATIIQTRVVANHFRKVNVDKGILQRTMRFS